MPVKIDVLELNDDESVFLRIGVGAVEESVFVARKGRRLIITGPMNCLQAQVEFSHAGLRVVKKTGCRKKHHGHPSLSNRRGRSR